MIISASRRTDIPACYADWFLSRIREGFVLVRNPRSFRQISRIPLTPDAVDGIVFWTKNPAPMLDRLDELQEYMYYFQFTVTPYGKDIEPNLPSKNGEILTSFKRLADKIGPDRVIWRYDPILISERYSEEYHIRAFQKMADELHAYTRKVTVSFLEEGYRAVKTNLKELALKEVSESKQRELAAWLEEIARGHGLRMDACAEKIDLRPLGIEKARCVDSALFEKLLGRPLRTEKDKGQRPECGCAASIDIGMYNTCPNGCRYCYANYNQQMVSKNVAMHNALSPLICGAVGQEDIIKERGGKST